MLNATLSTADAAQAPWEFVILGAGPAGSFAALRLAQAGRTVLVLEKKSFPRAKVCGGCIGADALDLLRAAGIGTEVAALPQASARALQLHAGGRSARWAVRPLQIIAREDLDACVLRAAIRAGAHFLPETTAYVRAATAGERKIDARRDDGEFCVSAGCVIAADGLAHTSLQRTGEFRDRTARRSHVGLGTILAEEATWLASSDLSPGTVQMALGRGGYVGIARGAADRLHVAAAVSPRLLARRAPSEVIGDLLHAAGQPAWAERARQHWHSATWCGTPPLTHQLNRAAADRLLVLGDAAAYVEPFTGEGVYWALCGAELAARCAERVRTKSPVELSHVWQTEYFRGLARRSRRCRLVAALLRTPWPPAWTLSVLNAWPTLAEFLVRRLNRSPAVAESGLL